MENPIKMDDLGVPPFKETPKCRSRVNFLFKNSHLSWVKIGGISPHITWQTSRFLVTSLHHFSRIPVADAISEVKISVPPSETEVSILRSRILILSAFCRHNTIMTVHTLISWLSSSDSIKKNAL